MNEKRQQVIEKILEEIHYGNIVVKGRLPSERQLAQRLNENRTVVREALISLEAMGVIDIRERQGIYLSTQEGNEAKALLNVVGQWPADTLSQVMEIRQLFDPAAAALCAIRSSRDDVEKLANCVESMRALLHDGNPEAAKSGAYWNTIYHSIIVSSTGNSYLIRIYEHILSTIEHSMSLMRFGREPNEYGGRHISFREHESLLQAIRNRDAEGAARIAEEHLAHTIKAMVSLGQIVPSSDLYGQKVAGRLCLEQPNDEKEIEGALKMSLAAFAAAGGLDASR